MSAGAIAIVLLLIATAVMIKNMLEVDTSTNIINIQQETNSTEILTLGVLRRIEGSSSVIVSLASDDKGGSKSFKSSYGSSRVRNYLFINNKNGTQHWLFKDNGFLIHHISFLTHEGYEKKNETVEIILYRVIKSDSNKDNILSGRDLETIAISRADGSIYKELITGVDRYIGEKFIDKETLLMIYQKKGVGFYTKLKSHLQIQQLQIANFCL